MSKQQKIRTYASDTSSKAKKSRRCLTVRKNKRSAGTGGSSSTHSNPTKSYQPNNVRTTRYMIPCSPTSSDTAAHNFDTVSNASSPSHFTKNISSNVSQVRIRSTTKKLRHAWKITKNIIFDIFVMVMKVNENIAENQGMVLFFSLGIALSSTPSLHQFVSIERF